MSDPSRLEPNVEIASPFGFDDTVNRIRQAILAAGLLVISQVDHAAGAASAGLAMPPTLVIIYGHPKGGTPIMQAVPAAALDLPLRVLVRADVAGRVVVSFQPIVALLARHGVAAELAKRLEPAQQLIRNTLTAA